MFTKMFRGFPVKKTSVTARNCLLAMDDQDISDCRHLWSRSHLRQWNHTQRLLRPPVMWRKMTAD